MTPADSVALPDATKLAVDRTRLAHDRTLLAWIRTSTSLISFGFTVYKFFQYMDDANPGARTERAIGPPEFALVLLATGVVVLLAATFDHRRQMGALRAEYRVVPYSMATMLAGLISLLGILGFVAVVFRL